MRTSNQAAAEIETRTKPEKGNGVPPSERTPEGKKVNALKVMSSLAGGLLPDQKYIQEGLRNGTITKQSIGMRSIVVDTSLQARVPQDDTGKHFNMDHVRKLAAIRDSDEGKPLAPIVLFFDRKAKKYYIADGFHRHEENRLRKCGDISAYVVDVPEWRHEATLFAAMCNQELCLPRRREDIRKAVDMLFADPVCWKWSNIMIGKKCGVSSTAVTKYRVLWCEDNKVCLPDKVIGVDGIPVNYQREKGKQKIFPTCSYPGAPPTAFKANVNGKQKHLGSTITEAEAKLKTILAERERKYSFLRYAVLVRFMLQRGVSGEVMSHQSSTFPIPKGCPGLKGLRSRNALCVAIDFQDPRDVPWAIGCLMMLRETCTNPPRRLVVVCYPEDGPSASIEAARRLGIEFLTPVELVESLKAGEPTAREA